jgi:malonyl-CoA O-methyltransferase
MIRGEKNGKFGGKEVIDFRPASAQRKPQFRLNTQIYRSGAGVWLLKTPATPEAQPFIGVIDEREELAERFFSGIAGIASVVRGKRKENGLEYPYLPWPTVEQRIAEVLRGGDEEAALPVLNEYLSVLRRLPSRSCVPEQFLEFIGSRPKASRPLFCFTAGPVDLTPHNILAGDDGYHIIDNEFFFDFPVPVEFVVYHALSWLVLTRQNEIRANARHAPITPFSGLRGKTYIPVAWAALFYELTVPLTTLDHWCRAFRQQIEIYPMPLYLHLRARQRGIGAMTAKTAYIFNEARWRAYESWCLERDRLEEQEILVHRPRGLAATRPLFRNAILAKRCFGRVIRQLAHQMPQTTKLSGRIRHPLRTLRNAMRRLVQISPLAEHLVARLKSSVGSSRQVDLVSRYQAALQWLQANTLPSAGVRVFAGAANTYPEVTGYLIPSLLDWGERDLATQYARWLMSIQNSDGSWSDSAGKAPYTFDTGQILKGLLAITPIFPNVESSIRQGCDWMLKQIETSGRITTPDKSDWGLPDGKTISENIHLYALEPLREAGKRLTEPRYLEAVDRALAYYLAQPDLTDFNTLSHFHAYVLEALIDLGYPELAAKGMAEVGRLQRADGSVPAFPDVDWVCSTGLAQYAVIWYKLGKREHAVKAFDGFCRLQNRSGGFYGSYGRGANYFSDREISWAVKFFLDAYQWHIRTAFDSQASEFPDLISLTDGRFQAIKSGLGQITGQCVLDAGCGRGRFARALLEEYPNARVVGVDISAEMLKCVPSSVETRQGSLLNLPFAENSFDHAYSVEALEHAINPESAIAELCRVVKPGGRIIVIDKNQERHGALKIESWERWFKRSEVESWLRKYCADVRSERISYDHNSEPDGLFFAWQGTRR